MFRKIINIPELDGNWSHPELDGNWPHPELDGNYCERLLFNSAFKLIKKTGKQRIEPKQD